MIVAIDGPAGAGKSTVSQRLAQKLGFIRIDTGALYRTIALGATNRGLGADDVGVDEFLANVAIDLVKDAVLLDGVDVSDRIRTPEVSRAASEFSARPAVRARLLTLQRELGRRHNSIVDGRDIGTVVFPDAEVKIFLTASVDARAERRLAELVSRGVAADLDDVRSDIINRDRADSEREIAPLMQASDAVLVDATHRGLDEVVQACFDLVEAHKRSC